MKFIKNVNLYGELTDIGVEGGIIAHIGRCDTSGVDFDGAKIYPGLIDTHAHGCIGLDATEDALQDMSRYFLEHGTTTWYPTTVTASKEDIVAACKRETDFPDGANIPGFHLEGPFINPKYKGALNECFIREPSMELIRSAGRVKKITVAPEIGGCIDFIRECDAVVSLGHTTADYETAISAFEAGATCLTHTFNAMPPLLHRQPGPIAAGADFGAYAELICDGIHVHPTMVRALVRLYGTDRVVLVSDALRPAGLEDGEYTVGGIDVIVKAGQARTREGNLAGSTSMLLDCVRCAISFGIDEYDAVKMASENPARMMGLNKGRIEVGYDADFIIVDGKFELIKVIVRGEF